jgi:predicted GNAT family N-acyltransferase
MPYTVRYASTEADREAAYALRRRVFEEEQNVPRPLDRDAADHQANHVVAFDEAGNCVGTGRFVRRDNRVVQIGRMAVDAAHRRHGVGALVMEALERMAVLRGIIEVVLHAQLPSVKFFERRGYQQEGETFLEEGVPHIRMRKVLLPPG